ncbi:MAG: hypothetical protein KJ593_01990 [Candidatus Omnitrophica bacterium]|nr:hypothetical protein [Candidatus Omnitrophota bacterium]
MISESRKLQFAIRVLVIFSFVFLSLSVSSSFAEGIFGRNRTKASIEKKIKEARKKLDAERYKLRLEEAKRYLENGDRYHAQGKTSEALGEWFTALALIEILKDAEFDSVDDARAVLEREVKDRLKVDKSSKSIKDRRRLKKMDDIVDRILKEQKTEAMAREEIQKKEPVEEKEEAKKIAKEIVPEEKEGPSLEDLEVMKENRQMVEEIISAQLARAREEKMAKEEEKEAQDVEKFLTGTIIVQQGSITEQEKKALLSQEDSVTKRKIDVHVSSERIKEQILKEENAQKARSEAKEKASQSRLKKQERIQEAKDRLEQQRKARQERLERRKALSEERSRKRLEAALVEKDKASKRKMEARLNSEMALQEKENLKLKDQLEKKQKSVFKEYQRQDKLDMGFKKKAESLTHEDIDLEGKQRKDLKAKIEKREEKDLSLLQKKRKKDAKRQLKQLESEQKRIARKIEDEFIMQEKTHPKSHILERKLTPSEQGPDRFDLIDRFLRKVEGRSLD